MPSLMVKKDGMILENLIYSPGFLNRMQVCIANNLMISKMLQISWNLQQI